ncbi:MAG TPA: hypothetical protein VEB86_11375 [Chryseosolibacter sp.]|nr:hypothetical protein [Chryseosolibacter sp.]
MNRLFLIVLAVAALTFSCDKLDDLLTFYINHDATFTIEATAPVNLPIDISTPDIATNSSQDFENNNTRSDLVKDVKLNDLSLTITAPAGENFDFLKSVFIYISTDSNNEVLLASVEEVPMNVTFVEMIPTESALDSYVKASSYSLRTKIVTRETLTEAVDVKVDMEFKVTAKPL